MQPVPCRVEYSKIKIGEKSTIAGKKLVRGILEDCAPGEETQFIAADYVTGEVPKEKPKPIPPQNIRSIFPSLNART